MLIKLFKHMKILQNKNNKQEQYGELPDKQLMPLFKTSRIRIIRKV